MPTESYEFSGKTVDDAIAEGLQSLKRRLDEVEVEVLNRGSRGIFGLGSEPALVRIKPLAPAPTAPPPQPETPARPGAPVPDQAPATTPSAAEPSRPSEAVPDEESPDEGPEEDVEDSVEEEPVDESPEDEEVATVARDFLLRMVQLMGFDATVQTSWQEGTDELGEQRDRHLLLNIEGVELGALIGRRGETLDSLQYLLRLMVNQNLRRWENVVVDVEGYKERRITQLKQLAERTAAQVAATGRAISLEPMPPNERRIVHIALREHPDVYTESSGEGDRRKVHIVAKG